MATTILGGTIFDNETYTPASGKMPIRGQARRLVLKPGFRKYQELFDSLIGATSGGAALKRYFRIAADTGIGGGQRTVEEVTIIDRNTDADDVTALKEMMVVVSRAATYPADLSGNGGPAYG